MNSSIDGLQHCNVFIRSSIGAASADAAKNFEQPLMSVVSVKMVDAAENFEQCQMLAASIRTYPSLSVHGNPSSSVSDV